MGGIAKTAPTRSKPDPLARTDLRLGRIVRVLSDNPMLVVSGTKLAAEIGSSRSEVWRLVQQLRSAGVQIAGHPLTGYRLKEVPDLLLPEVLAPLIKGTMFSGHIHHYFRVGSTNVLGMQAASNGEPEGTVLFAEEQTAGHGRGGHSWHSARSTGLYVSVILRPQMAPAEVLALSLMAGVAATAAVEEITGVRPDIRWPNDLLFSRQVSRDGSKCAVEERKFCGILTELNAEVTRVRFAVLGIGMNVNQESFPRDLADTATSLRIETGKPWSRVELAAALLKLLDREYRRISPQLPLSPRPAGVEASPREALFRRFEQASSYARGRHVHVDEDGGYAGVTEGLDERGFLRVRTDQGTVRTVLSGGVRGLNHEK